MVRLLCTICAVTVFACGAHSQEPYKIPKAPDINLNLVVLSKIAYDGEGGPMLSIMVPICETVELERPVTHNGQTTTQRYTTKMLSCNCERVDYDIQAVTVWNVAGEVLGESALIERLAKPTKVFLIRFADGQKVIPSYKYEPYYADMLHPNALIVRVKESARPADK